MKFDIMALHKIQLQRDEFVRKEMTEYIDFHTYLCRILPFGILRPVVC
jgi:hypothetical protein